MAKSQRTVQIERLQPRRVLHLPFIYHFNQSGLPLPSMDGSSQRLFLQLFPVF